LETFFDRIILLDKELFIWLNSFNNEFFDYVMFAISGKLIWIPLYILLLYFIFRTYKIQTILVLVMVVLLVTLTDQISVLIKFYFHRLRPSHNPEFIDIVHVVNDYRGGAFGFISSHAANTFGFATLISLILKNNFKYISIIFLWALIVSYSRIYLGVHYPLDIIGGIILGIISGYFIYIIFLIFQSKFFIKIKQKLF